MLFVGLYVALAPDLYRRGPLALLAPSARKSGDQVLRKAAATLRNWLIAQLMAMAVVGVLTWLGLWLVGVPLAPILGLLAALLAFVPNIGPILSAVPAILLAMTDGATAVLLVIGVYAAVQTLESYVITPMIRRSGCRCRQRSSSRCSSMGVLFGLLGLALATPLAALGLAMVKEIYVVRYLEAEPSRDGGGCVSAASGEGAP